MKALINLFRAIWDAIRNENSANTEIYAQVYFPEF